MPLGGLHASFKIQVTFEDSHVTSNKKCLLVLEKSPGIQSSTCFTLENISVQGLPWKAIALSVFAFTVDQSVQGAGNWKTVVAPTGIKPQYSWN